MTDHTPALIARIRAQKLTYLSERKLASLAETLQAIDRAGLPGIFLEAGCALGGSAILIATLKQPHRPLRLYDAFETIPAPTDDDTPDVRERYRVIAEGRSDGIDGETYYGYLDDLYGVVRGNLERFGIDCTAQSVSLVKGLVQDTLHLDEPVAFAHVDVDWFEPTATCLSRIFPKLAIGGSLVIDDYHAWGGCRKATNAYLRGVADRVLLDDRSGALKITKVQH